MNSDNNKNWGKTQEAELESEIKSMLEASGKGFIEITECIKEHMSDYPGDLAEFAFREAVRMGNTEYVDAFAQEIDLNDCDDCSSYLDETDDEEMLDLLMSHGAFRSWDYYEDCLFAVETVNGEILAFDPEFQKSIYEQYKKKFDLTDDEIIGILDQDDDAPETDRYVEEDMEALGVSFDDGEPQFMDMISSMGSCTRELLEELGWSCSFEGDEWKLETAGVYFINREEAED